MLPILSTDQVREADQFTIKNKPIKSIDLMEKACESFVAWFIDLFGKNYSITIICGPGNNGGDGLGIGRMLLDRDYKVRVLTIPSDRFSEDYKVNLRRITKLTTVNFVKPEEVAAFESEIIIDAIFGSGLSREPGGIYKEVIEKINSSEAIVVSVDIPSGLKGEEHSTGSIVHADFTISFQFPKMAFLLPENGNYTGEWEVVDIGIMNSAWAEYTISNYLIQKDDIQSIWPLRHKFDHKGKFGHLLLAGGSYGKMGAILLSSQAALRGGIGLLTAHIPSCGYNIMQTAVPEAMVNADIEADGLSSAPELENYTVVACGPGMGTEENPVRFLKEVLEKAPDQLVLDADALNILASHRELLKILPKNSILTPHPGEFRRLAGEWTDDYQKIDLLKEFSKTHQCIIVLKGAHTITCLPEGDLYFNSTGNPGMATGGSGDVLTGIIAALLGQWNDPAYASIAGVYLHGLAGDLAAGELGEDSVIASDIVRYLPEAIREIY